MTDSTDRREFIKKSAGTALGAAVVANLPACASLESMMGGKRAEAIYKGGTIVTMDDKRRQVAAVAVAGGRIIAAGDEAEVMKTKGEVTKIVDLGRTTLMPSFIDSHGHFMNAPRIVTWANVSGPPVGPVTKIADFVPVLQEHV